MNNTLSHDKGPQHDSRLEDYLNDRLQTSADLESIDRLLLRVNEQQRLLRAQLTEAEAALQHATQESLHHEQTIHEKVKQFDRTQADVDRRLLIITQSETSDGAISRFESSMGKLRRLDVAKGYMEILQEVDRLSQEARQNMQSSPKTALPAYARLRTLVAALEEAQPAAEGAAPHLIDHVEQTTLALWKQMKDDLDIAMQKTLKKMRWPGKDLNLTENLVAEWSTHVDRLLDLQEPELRSLGPKGDKTPLDESIVLLPLEVMVRPLVLRFKYHFSGDKPTNRLDKPEYFLSHILDLLNDYDEFFSTYLQPIFDTRATSSNYELDWIYNNATSAFITSLLPALREKAFSFLPQISGQPQFLSHFLHELINFDTTLRDEWGYDGNSGMEGWKGMTWEVLVKKDWFGRWLQVEKEFALSRYQTIIDTPDSGEIDHDSIETGHTKPTKAAIRVNDLLETITDSYRPLLSFSQKLRFLIDIQIAIFDKFHERLRSSLEAYLTMTSTIGRTVQGASMAGQNPLNLSGAAGLDRLCRVFGSSEYLEKKMLDWSDDLFFLELWAELQDRVKRNSNSGRNLAGSMSVSDVAERTSSAVADNSDDGALFDETASAYRQLRLRSESILEETISTNVREALRPYGRISPWSSLSSSSDTPSTLAPTSELDTALQQLSTSLRYLASVLAPAPLRRIARQVCLAVQTWMWDHVLMRYSFSASGATQFSRDIFALWDIVDQAVGVEGEGQAGMRKLAEGVGLLNLPIRAEQKKEVDSQEESGRNVNLPEWGLWEVEERVFKDNESAREILGEMGFENLSEGDARGILGRRVELSA